MEVHSCGRDPTRMNEKVDRRCINCLTELTEVPKLLRKKLSESLPWTECHNNQQTSSSPESPAVCNEEYQDSELCSECSMILAQLYYFYKAFTRSKRNIDGLLQEITILPSTQRKTGFGIGELQSSPEIYEVEDNEEETPVIFDSTREMTQGPSHEEESNSSDVEILNQEIFVAMFCSDCGDEIVSETSLESHICQNTNKRQKADPTLLLTEIPPKNSTFLKSKFQNIIQENQGNNDELNFCKICDKSFRSAKYFQLHNKIHALNPHNCQECGKSFRSLEEIQLHIQIHEEDESWKREIDRVGCTTITVVELDDIDLDDSENTKQAQTKKDTETVICNFCQKILASKKLWNGHVKTHRTPVKCPKCSRQYKLTIKLQEHLETHFIKKATKSNK